MNQIKKESVMALVIITVELEIELFKILFYFNEDKNKRMTLKEITIARKKHLLYPRQNMCV